MTLLALAMLLGVSIALVSQVRYYDLRASLEATQRMNIALARYIADSQPPLFDREGAVERQTLRELAKQVMMINPALEVYLLDADGEIVAHALDGAAPMAARVDVSAFAPLLSTRIDAPRLPVLGDDPRRPERRAIFSVTAIARSRGSDVITTPSPQAMYSPDQIAGYLYIVLDGAGRRVLAGRRVNDSAAPSWSRDSLREATIAIGLLIGGAAIAFLVALRGALQPLRRLTRQVQSVRLADSRAQSTAGGDEVAMLGGAISAMKLRIDEQFERLALEERRRSELIGNISHDLQTPLANVQGYIESLLLDDGRLGHEERTSRLRIALRHAHRTGERIRSLFELSRLDAATDTAGMEPFVPAELLQDIINGYRLAADSAGVRLLLLLDGTRDAAALGDIASIDRLLQNLIDNALRHTPCGGTIEISMSERIIDAGADSRLSVRVRDTGTGISADDLPHVCERHWARERHGGEAGCATGLGLAIAKRIAERHGSSLTIESMAGVGTTICFSLERSIR